MNLWGLMERSTVIARLSILIGYLVGWAGKTLSLALKNSWFLQKFTFLGWLVAGELQRAAEVLREIEQLRIASAKENQLRFLYQSLAFVCLKHNALEVCTRAFEIRINQDADCLWAWRILVDYTYYLGDLSRTRDIHEKFINRRDRYANRFNIDVMSDRYFGPSFTYAFGHICCLAAYAKAKVLGGTTHKRYHLFLDRRQISNRHLINYLAPHFNIHSDEKQLSEFENRFQYVEDPFLCQIKFFDKWYDLYDALYQIEEKWDQMGHGPFFTLTPEDNDLGRRIIREHGLPNDAWFVTLHARSASGGSIRNVDIMTYIPAILEITKRGGWVIRIGDDNAPPLPKLSGLIDLTRLKPRCERLDLYLLAASKFCITTTSGPANAPGLFGNRSLQTNLIPLRHSVANANDLVLPVLYKSRATGEILSFNDVLAYPLSSEILIRRSTELSLIYNSALDIRDATVEMLHSFETTITPSHNQVRFKQLCECHGIQFRPLVSESFLRRNEQLLV